MKPIKSYITCIKFMTTVKTTQLSIGLYSALNLCLKSKFISSHNRDFVNRSTRKTEMVLLRWHDNSLRSKLTRWHVTSWHLCFVSRPVLTKQHQTHAHIWMQCILHCGQFKNIRFNFDNNSWKSWTMWISSGKFPSHYSY